MKKLLLSMCIALMGVGASAQTTEKLSFLKDVRFDLSVGYGTKVSNEVYTKAAFTLHAGLDAIIPIKSFKDDKFTVSGLTGVHYVQKGGKISNDAMEFFDDRNSLSIHQLSIPFHAMGSVNFKKCSLFMDFGPYLAFRVGGDDQSKEVHDDMVESNTIDYGVGFNMGVRFKRFGLSVGWDIGLANMAKYTEYGGDAFNLKGSAMYMSLRWLLGNIDK
jgi:hypothetical protein